MSNTNNISLTVTTQNGTTFVVVQHILDAATMRQARADVRTALERNGLAVLDTAPGIEADPTSSNVLAVLAPSFSTGGRAHDALITRFYSVSSYFTAAA